jgi:hypothetical protein
VCTLSHVTAQQKKGTEKKDRSPFSGRINPHSLIIESAHAVVILLPTEKTASG